MNNGTANKPGEDPKLVGFLCMGNEPVQVAGQLFEWTAWGGWCPVNQDGSERLALVPAHVWAAIEAIERDSEIT